MRTAPSALRVLWRDQYTFDLCLIANSLVGVFALLLGVVHWKAQPGTEVWGLVWSIGLMMAVFVLLFGVVAWRRILRARRLFDFGTEVTARVLSVYRPAKVNPYTLLGYTLDGEQREVRYVISDESQVRLGGEMVLLVDPAGRRVLCRATGSM